MPHTYLSTIFTGYSIYTVCSASTIVSVHTYQWIKIYPVSAVCIGLSGLSSFTYLPATRGTPATDINSLLTSRREQKVLHITNTLFYANLMTSVGASALHFHEYYLYIPNPKDTNFWSYPQLYHVGMSAAKDMRMCRAAIDQLGKIAMGGYNRHIGIGIYIRRRHRHRHRHYNLSRFRVWFCSTYVHLLIDISYSGPHSIIEDKSSTCTYYNDNL